MRRFVALSLVTAALVVAGGAAHAQATPAQAPRPEMTRSAVEQRTAQSFARMDANGDGKLDTADREARRKQMFDRVDADGDGAISFTEYTARRDGRPDARAEKQPRGPRFHGRRSGAHAADADSDGAVTQAEFAAAALARFDRADADKDGTISRDERRAARGTVRHRRQPREAG